jgi:hypothetical protein
LITRVRRGTFADILKALRFHLGMPKFGWKKVIGSTKLGASFGLRMENFVDLNLGKYFLCMCFYYEKKAKTDCQEIHQYQQNEQSPLTLNH